MTRLTPRQREALALAADGWSNAEAAGLMGVSEQTVKAHLRDAAMVLGVVGRGRVALLLASGAVARPGHEHQPVTACRVCGALL